MPLLTQAISYICWAAIMQESLTWGILSSMKFTLLVNIDVKVYFGLLITSHQFVQQKKLKSSGKQMTI